MAVGQNPQRKVWFTMAQNKTEQRAARGQARKWLLSAALPAAALLVYWLFGSRRSFANSVAQGFSRPFRLFMGRLSAHIPFSMMEVVYAAIGVFVVVFLIVTVVRIVRGPRRWRVLLRRLLTLAVLVAYGLSLYVWIWGIDYNADTFTEISGMATDGVPADELYAVTKYFVTGAAASAGAVKRDADGHFAEDMDEYFAESVHVYDNLAKEYPTLAGQSLVPKKVFFSKFMSKTGFTGVYYALTGESNINVDAPACMIPFTIAHELAHQHGVCSEQEANFLGVAACLSSGMDVYVYSGYLAGSIYLMNALHDADYEKWEALYGEITGPYLTDWNDNNAYWASMRSQVTKASENVYDTYLKANGQQMGIKSYGACVDLLVTYYFGKLPAAA